MVEVVVDALRGKRPSRVLSGVTVVAVMTAPYPCPHGKCAYCPGGPEYGTPQSYYGDEPALMRALRVGYDPYEQVRVRLRQYEYLGYRPSKVDVIVMGGTFTALPEHYQEWFVTSLFEAFNRYPEDRPEKLPSLEEAQLRNETARIRVVGLTFETRPDHISEYVVNRLLYLGGTRVEIGVQSIYDDVLRIVERGHTVKETIKATQLLKDSGFKVVYHIMPGLPGSNFERDLEMVRELFENPDFRPDMLKIYPTLVVKGTKLYQWWVEGRYKALSDEEAVELISEMYRYIPKWVRIMRIQRDLPAQYIEAGPKKGNLRELVELRALSKGIKINEIRFREVGRSLLLKGRKLANVEVLVTEYEASGGVEVFISAEDIQNDVLVGLLRLRIPSEKAFRPEIDSKTAIIRELHVYGPQLPVGEEPRDIDTQHLGVGAKLLKKAEEVAYSKYDKRKILILSGIGVREYYRKLGYWREKNSPYMMKLLT
ncbi:MAG: tRNA uridine(34) 5-carboxymethylaminomethyl modification radical SAM/GNAT enzyme Elp3 [Desulfurococcaceae archaeon]|nr:tRNA uridine(34) 5-carboxymethylaminomethyl modification radical SAM/GNAT enzyme Elp3 [Desulfurococcaceae archaeon]